MPAKKKKKSSVGEKLLITLFSLIITASLLCVAGVFLMNTSLFANREPDTGNDNTLDPEIVTPVEAKEKSVNILLVGIDYTEASNGARGKLTDTIMVINYDMETQQVNVLQIPRDTYIGEDYPTGKINAIYGQSANGGIEGLANRINQCFKLPIDHYVTINMDGFVGLVDAIGGVEIDVQESFTLEGITISPGLQTLDGITAEKFVRERHHRQGGDFGRMEAQATFLKALVQKVFSMGTAQVVSMAPSLIQYITTDLTLAQMLGYYNSIDGLDLNNINFHTLPVVGTMYNGLSVQSIKRYPTADLLNEYFRPYQNAVPAEGLDVIEIVKDYEYTPSNTAGDPSSGE